MMTSFRKPNTAGGSQLAARRFETECTNRRRKPPYS